MITQASSSMITSDQLVITGGCFTQVLGTCSGHGSKPAFDILKDKASPSAFHNSAYCYDTPKCHENTRVAVLRRIMNWILGRDSETRDKWLMWLTGAAGAGKSSVAQTIISQCIAQKLVIASFFFNRSDGARNHGESLVATLAYQIYFSIPDTQHQICSAINNDPLIFSRALEHQFDTLIIQPLRTFFENRTNNNSILPARFVIVIDGLDECVHRPMQRRIVEMLIDGGLSCGLPLMILLASRPEHDIKTALTSNIIENHLTRLVLDDEYKPDDDILLYLRDSFADIKKKHPFKTNLPPIWPTSDVLQHLVKKSSGQFAYAATVVRYVQSIRHQPHSRLHIALELRPAEGDMPFAQLDGLYRTIISLADNKEKVLHALGVCITILESNMGIQLESNLIERILLMEKGELEIVLCDLGSLVSFSENPWPTGRIKIVKFLHASFQDFLLDATRSKEYSINIDAYRPLLVARVLYLLHHDLPDYWKLLRLFSVCSETCLVTPEIIDQVTYFPLHDLLTKAIDQIPILASYESYDVSQNNIPLGGSWRDVVEQFLVPFIRLITRAARSKSLPTDSFLQRHQEELDSFYRAHMSHYYQNDTSASFLSLSCYAGSDALVPIVEENADTSFSSNAKPYRSRTHKLYHKTLYIDVLSLQTTFIAGDYMDHYIQHITEFLRDPIRAGEYYTLSSDSCAKAAMHCIQELEDWRLWWTVQREHSEQFLLNQTSFQDGIWLWKVPIGEHVEAEQSVFLLLGYISFFLPRSGVYTPLAQLCQDQGICASFGQLNARFPIRTRLATEAMANYAKMVTCATSNVD